MGAGCSQTCSSSNKNVIAPKEANMAWAKLNEEDGALDLGYSGSARTLVLGLRGSGKSAIVHALRTMHDDPSGLAHLPQSPPTRKIKEFEFTISGKKVLLVDTPGKISARTHTWAVARHVNRIVYVVDATDPQHMLLARAEIDKLIAMEPGILKIPMLIALSKPSAPGALPQNEMMCRMRLSRDLNLKQTFVDLPSIPHAACYVVTVAVRDVLHMTRLGNFLASPNPVDYASHLDSFVPVW